MQFSSINEVKRHARAWLFDHAAPLWASQGVLDDGMFAEKISLDGQADRSLNRRLRVQARQIYSFCTIGRMGWSGPWRQVTSRALDILLDRGMDDDRCVHLFSPQGTVVDRSRDLYDHAFLLFTLAHAGEVLGRPDALEAARRIRTGLAGWKRTQGGYWEGELTPCPPYRQNPHMHLFEAAYSHMRIDPDDQWNIMMRDLRRLFIDRLVDQPTGAVTEYFDDSWNKLEGSTGQIVEPGHCFEWSWLLSVAFEDPESRATADRLAEFARGHGICTTRDVAINEVSLDGSILDSNARLWPQTERLKTAVARHRRAGDANEIEEIIRAYRGLALYWTTPVPGTWWDLMDTVGSFRQEAAPASSFYHIVCALHQLDSL